MKTHHYGGEIIQDCERAAGEHAGRWIIASYHGAMRRSDQESPHYHTLAAARAAIRDSREIDRILAAL
jgi:hypothetical protein